MNETIQYFMTHLDEIWQQTIEHLMLTTISIVLASFIGISIGISMTMHQKLAKPILSIIGIIQTIPSLALLGFLLPLLGIGSISAVVALFLYALLPIVNNTFTGISELPTSTIEAATGMGMSRYQMLKYVKLPLAGPMIMSGIRTAAIINVGVATLCAYIGAGGLGQFIFRGISLNNSQMILAGAIPASILALLVNLLLSFQWKRTYSWIAFIIIAIACSISWLAQTHHTPSKLIAGFNSEFIEREDGFAGLDSLYDLPLEIKEMDIGLMYESVKSEYVDVIDGFSTDGRIEAYNLVLLEDDLKYFPPYFAAPIVRQKVIDLYPELSGVLNKFNGLISNKEMSQLNFRVDEQKKPLDVVAFEFLEHKGVSAKQSAGNSSSPSIRIGSKAFTENYLLAYMLAQAIEGHTNLQTSLILGFGGTKMIFDALKYEEIDMYVEYTGTGLFVILNEPASTLRNPDSVMQYVTNQFQTQHQIIWMKPFGFNNSFALMMRKQHADSLGITSISDLSKYLNQ